MNAAERRDRFSELLDQRGRAIWLRSRLISHIRATGDLTKPTEWLWEFTGQPLDYLKDFDAAKTLVRQIADGWHILWMSPIHGFFHTEFADGKRGHNPYRARFVSKNPEIVLVSSAIVLHIKNLTHDMFEIKLGLTNQTRVGI